MKRAGIALGSNQGNKSSLMSQALAALRELHVPGAPFLQSALYQTEPVGCPPGSDSYLNAVIELEWAGSVESLLVHCQQIERKLGRVRSQVRCEPRTADVDILYVDNMVIQDPPRLVIPHPRAHLRKFVLQPLADIQADRILPGQSRTVRQLLAALPAAESSPVLVSTVW